MKCQFCGRQIRTAQSIERKAGPCCYRRDREQIKFDFEVEDGQTGKDGRSNTDMRAGSLEMPAGARNRC